MRVAHFDCFSGISGDMVLGALIDGGVPDAVIRAALDSLGLPHRDPGEAHGFLCSSRQALSCAAAVFGRSFASAGV